MKKSRILAMTDREVMKIIGQLRTAYKLKRVMRYATKRNHSEHNESVAEHIFAMLFLSEYFLTQEKVPKSFDIEKLHRIIIFHDLSEIAHGDVPTHDKNHQHVLRERKAARKVFASLPQPFGKEAYEHWHTFEFQEGPEARFANALDKVEPVFELLDPVNQRTLKRMKTTYELHMGKKLLATESFPVMRKIVEVTGRNMAQQGLFWKK